MLWNVIDTCYQIFTSVKQKYTNLVQLYKRN